MHRMNKACIYISLLFILLGIPGYAQVFPDSLETDLFEQLDQDYYKKHAIPFDQENPQNLHYRVKVGTFTGDVSSSFFQQFFPVTGIHHGNAKRYYIGLFTHYTNAELAREILVESGYKDAFLVAFKNSKELSLSKAIEMENTLFISSAKTNNTITSDVRVFITELPEKEEARTVIDSSKLRDNAYYLDYFYYEFENAVALDGLNSEAEEIMPILWPSDSTISFVRAFSPENVGGLESGHDVWIGTKSGQDFQVSGPFEKVNTIHNNAIVGLSKDGKRAYLLNQYDKNESKRGLSMISLNSGQWSEPQIVEIPDLPFTGNFYGMYVHPDEDLILLSMQGKESYGQNDIYVIEKENDGQWGALLHLDSTINTDGNDISPYISNDKRLFIYSTDGMGGVGGNDLIVFKRQDSTWTSWSDAQNVGIDVNTAQFEAYPFIHKNKLYFSSVRDSGLADLYSADIVSSMFRPIEEYLEMEDSLLFTYNVEAGTLSNDENENVAIESIPVLAMVNTDSRIDMIFFDYDRYNLKPTFTRFLNELEKILVENPTINLDLRGHTDSIGSLAYNYILGENRALSVKDYLISIGISPSRIIASSFGKEIPIASNETAYGRAKNRRVEIRFVRKEE